jgi:hypothetical protein
MNIAKMKGKRLEFRTGVGGMGERIFILMQLGSLLSTGNLEIEETGEESRQGIVFPVLTGRKWHGYTLEIYGKAKMERKTFEL